VVAGLAIPAWYARHDVTLDSAALLLARDLRATQNRAAYLGISAKVVVDSDGWRAFDGQGRPLSRTGGSERIERRFSIDGVFEGVRIERIDLGPDDALAFGPMGQALEAGAVVLSFRGEQRILHVFEKSGLVSIEGLQRDWVDDGR